MKSIPPLAASNGRKIRLEGKSGKFWRDEHGNVTALIIGNHLVELPARLVKDLLPVLKDSVNVSVKGFERRISEGFVNTTGLTIVKPSAITINNTDYVL